MIKKGDFVRLKQSHFEEEDGFVLKEVLPQDGSKHLPDYVAGNKDGELVSRVGFLTGLEYGQVCINYFDGKVSFNKKHVEKVSQDKSDIWDYGMAKVYVDKNHVSAFYSELENRYMLTNDYRGVYSDQPFLLRPFVYKPIFLLNEYKCHFTLPEDWSSLLNYLDFKLQVERGIEQLPSWTDEEIPDMNFNFLSEGDLKNTAKFFLQVSSVSGVKDISHYDEEVSRSQVITKALSKGLI